MLKRIKVRNTDFFFKLLVYFFLFIAIFVPAIKIFNIKKLSFLFIVIYWFLCVLAGGGRIKNQHNINIRLIIISIIFLLSFLYLILTRFYDVSHGEFIIFSFINLFLIIIFYDKQINLLKMLNNIIFLLAIVVIIIVLLSNSSKIISIYTSILFNKINAGYIGTRRFGNIEFRMVHFRTSPVFIFSFLIFASDFIVKKRIFVLVKLFLIGFAIYFSASRGVMLFTFIGLLIITFYFSTKGNRLAVFLFIFLLITFIITIIYINKSTDLFSLKEASNLIKYKHYLSFRKLINNNPSIILWGQGVGSTYYSTGFGKTTFQTELTFLDMIRYFGFPLTILLFSLLLVPFKRKYNFVLFVSFVMYFIDGMTNPLLFNSTGTLVILVYWLSQINREY